MSKAYDDYIDEHRANIWIALEWMRLHIPEVLEKADKIGWHIYNAHDRSKYSQEEYDAYDKYFYGNNRSYEVVQNFRLAWLHHIHENPHHWQHWILVNDDREEGTIALEMPYHYIIEMICDWWSFSWATDNLMEIFHWYDEHRENMILAKNTRKTVEDILSKIAKKLDYQGELWHHGIKGQKWGVKNGPPYPLDEGDKSAAEKAETNTHKSNRPVKNDAVVENAINSGQVSTKINREKQLRHTLENHDAGRSYIHGDLEYAQKLVDELSGTGEPIILEGNRWNHNERVSASEIIGTHVDQKTGKETETSNAMIVYSKTGTHIYPRKDGK